MIDPEYDVLIKTSLGFERIVANRIKEIDPTVHVTPSPHGFKGLVLVKSGRLGKDELVKAINREVVEADKIIPIMFESPADPRNICKILENEIRKYIRSDETFAVRTTRRGRHQFTSVDVNVIVGDCVRRATGALVDLRYPDKIVLVEIIQDHTYISILPGSFEYHKYSREKKLINKIFSNMAVVQMPFLGPLESVIEMGKRIGREVQNFEVREIVIAPIGVIEAYPLAHFIMSVIDGIRSRYIVQRKTYARRPRQVPVYLMDLHQLVRDRGNEPIIVFEPEGKYILDVADQLADLVLRSKKRVNLLFGSRQGIPVGVYRYADLVVDIAPGITLSTDYAAAAGLIALATAIYNKIEEGQHESTDPGGR